MKECFHKPVLNVVKFEEDIITTSGEQHSCECPCGNQSGNSGHHHHFILPFIPIPPFWHW